MQRYEDFCKESRIDCLQGCPQLLAAQSSIENLEREEDVIITATMADSAQEMVATMNNSIFDIQLPVALDDYSFEERIDLEKQLRAALGAAQAGITESKEAQITTGKKTATACELGPVAVNVVLRGEVHNVSFCTSPGRSIDEHGNEIALHQVKTA